MLFLQTIIFIIKVLKVTLPFLNVALRTNLENKTIATICDNLCHLNVFLNHLLIHLYNIFLSKDGFLLLILLGLWINDDYYYTQLYLLYTVHSLCHLIENSRLKSPLLKSIIITLLKHIEKILILLIINHIFSIIIPVLNSF